MKSNLKSAINTLKQQKIVTITSMIYNFVWASGKILLGVLTGAYFLCISGTNTLLIGFIKKTYVSNSKENDQTLKSNKSLIIAVLLLITGILFTLYMCRLFFLKNSQEYGLILSISISTLSFFELGFAIYSLVQVSKTDDILLFSYKCCSLATSGFAIVTTQVALLSACKTNTPVYNAITGTVFGLISIIIALILMQKIKAYNNTNKKQPLN